MTMIRSIIDAIEAYAPLRLQEDYDNSGLQLGFPDTPVSKVLVSLDISEEVIDEAIAKGCNLVVSHHPLIFRPLRSISGASWQQRCVIKALSEGIALYSAHTNLDNVRGGVNYKIAEMIGLSGGLEWLRPVCADEAGSGVIGELPCGEDAGEFILRLKEIFGVECIRHNCTQKKTIRRVALCGGAGAFLMKDALEKGADCFITGELHYHDFFDGEGMILVELGHFQSEQFTSCLLRDIIHESVPEVEILLAETQTNPIRYAL